MRTRVQAGYVLLLAVLAGGIQCTAEGGGGEPCSRNLECIARSIGARPKGGTPDRGAEEIR